jgi:hypothetical protein
MYIRIDGVLEALLVVAVTAPIHSTKILSSGKVTTPIFTTTTSHWLKNTFD